MEKQFFIPERYMFVPEALNLKQTVYERIIEMNPDELAAYLAGITGSRWLSGLGFQYWRDLMDKEIEDMLDKQ